LGPGEDHTGRSLLALLAGLVAMALTVLVVESAGQMVFPTPPGTDPHDHAAMRAVMASMPAMALAFMVVAWALGAFVGGFVAAKVAREHRMPLALAVGAVMIALSAPSRT
jgi:hypothetical protein